MKISGIETIPNKLFGDETQFPLNTNVISSSSPVVDDDAEYFSDD